MAEASRPHCLASGVNDPPRVSVAEVSTTVFSANRCSASTSPTSSGATCSDAGRVLSDQSSGRSSQTTSSRSAIGWSNAPIIRSASTAISSRLTSAVCAAVTSAGSASSSLAPAIFLTCAAQAVAASRSAASVAPRPWSRWSIRPAGMVASSGASALPASDSRASSPSSASFPVRRTAKSTWNPDSSPLATEVTRSTSSCASSTMTTRCSGRMPPSPRVSIASSAWLVTMTSDSAASRLARSE